MPKSALRGGKQAAATQQAPTHNTLTNCKSVPEDSPAPFQPAPSAMLSPFSGLYTKLLQDQDAAVAEPGTSSRYFDMDFVLESLARGIAMAAVLFLGLQLSHAVASPHAAAAILEGGAQASALTGL